MSIDARLAPLIQDRAPWLFKNRPGTRAVKAILDHALGYHKTVAIGDRLDPLPPAQIMDDMSSRLAKHLTISGRSNIPPHGAALIVANHPTGIADAIMLHHVLRPIRDDSYFYANKDILRVLPQLKDRIAPVEWRVHKRSHASLRETMSFTKQATTEGRLGIIFPSGRLAKRRGTRLVERPWMASAAMIARKFNLPVIPIHMTARNSALFYIFDAISPSLRDITLFHETLNKDQQPFHLNVGEPISPSALPAKSGEAIELLRRATLSLGDPDEAIITLPQSLRLTGWL